ncbi:hypothetical protein BUALT_Bualt19G0097100 [Buddleja alternifolia]|uniref:BHLH domain-containing protein n=1 Tax=Buddleja alternifolia TaxID=168488 RepID=A0AAV6W0P0_9LAMI|nr:hypothetical protein BUALT_Bualt19G0097100 [Buddleja alternifolia]
MVTAKESPCQQFSAWNSPGLAEMALRQLEQNYKLPCLPPSTLDSASDLRGFNLGQHELVGGFSKSIPLYQDISYPIENPYFKSSHFPLSNGIRVTDKPVDASFAPQKRFLIFDQSGNDTRLFFSPVFSPQNRVFPSKTPAFANGPSEKVAARVEEKWGENNLSDEEGDMREDSEEIDALLYSDSDDEYDDDDDDENDEVTSTGHTPFEIDEKLLEEEVASCDGSPKRQKLLNGKYKKSSFGESPLLNRAISCNYEDDGEHSSYRISYDDDDDLDSSKRETKVKIRQALKMLENIIPGLNSSKDPLSIIDKAITYLKSMKTEAESLGLNYPGPEPAHGSSGSGH